MKIVAGIVAVLIAGIAFAQSPPVQGTKKTFGIKAGGSFSSLKNKSDIKAESQGNFMAGVFFSPVQKKGFGFRTELIFSRQGYNFRNNTATGDVKMDYLLVPALTTFNITRFAQLQFGPQMGYLLNAKADSTSTVSSTSTNPNLLSYYNRLDYGVAGGIEFFPVKGLMLGVRYNLSFGGFEKESSSTGITGINPKAHVVHLYAGWRF